MTLDTRLFFRRLTLFVALLVVPFGVLESVSRRIYADDTRLPAQKAHFEAGAVEQAETLVLGMAYLWRGVNPEYLERPAYNMAFSHQDFYYSWRLFEKYLPRMKALKVLVLGMDVNTVAYTAINTLLVPKFYSES